MPKHHLPYSPSLAKSETSSGSTASSPPLIASSPSPTAHYPPPTSHLPSPGLPRAPIPSPLANDASYAAALRIAFTKTLHLVPCAPATDVPLSRTLLPLAHSLPLVNRQLHAETAGRFWDANTLVLPDYAAGHEVLEYLGPASQVVKRVEMTIGNVWDVGIWQG
ncbi:hypothetical protein ACLOAV_002139 [Pseudogymnoascus australis]